MSDFYTVSFINQYIKSIISRDAMLSDITVKGEISGCKYHSSGHIYFTLKDSMSQIACVMFAGKRNGLDFKLDNGLEVVVTGCIQVYERDGRYQLYVDRITKDGIGLLYEKFEKLKQQLDGEGLFKVEFKKKIPVHARRIGVVTSATGAAIHDIMTVTRRRNPYVQLILYPAQVQGKEAAQTIVNGIETLDKLRLDCIIVGRGGGSIEDLMPFNEEIVARAIFGCNTPVISAVGHEIDFTIADYTADLRAATPSAAAELAVFDVNSYLKDLDDCRHELSIAMDRHLNTYRNIIEKSSIRLIHLSPQKRLDEKRERLVNDKLLLHKFIHDHLNNKRHEINIMIEQLKGLSPLSKLQKGYAYISTEEGNTVSSVQNLKTGEKLDISMTDGSVKAEILDINRSDYLSGGEFI